VALLADFAAAARARGRLEAGARLTVPAIFELVRDLPYARASDRRPGTTVAEWRATCTGKHVLLHALYAEFGLDSLLIHATHEFTRESAPWAPPELAALLDAGPVPDVHTFLRLERDGEWQTLDATWPLAAARLGLPVNERYEPGRDMRVACDPDELFHVPDASDVEAVDALKERILAGHVGAERERREAFILGLSAWLHRELGSA
jgi:hypothetical protein